MQSSWGPARDYLYQWLWTPKFFKACPVPFALRPKVDEALDRLVVQGILIPVKHSRWETPIVLISQKDGSLRICGDFRCTANTAVLPDVYPLPTVFKLFSSPAGGDTVHKTGRLTNILSWMTMQ